MVVRSMDLRDFPPLGGICDESCLADYLKGLLNSSGKNSLERTEPLVFLPSMRVLSQYFRFSPLEILKALDSLSEQGYRYFCMGLEAPITFCRQGGKLSPGKGHAVYKPKDG